MKKTRQAEIMKVIQSAEIGTQEQLLEVLKQRGFRTTQATISRDIKELRLVKELTGRGSYCYAAREHRDDSDFDVRLRSIFRQGVLSVDTAQNIVVIRTMPGLASAAASALDNMDIEDMVGSLAGDDTAILIMRDAAAAETFSGEVHTLLD